MWSPTLRPDDKTDDMEEIIGDAHIQNGFDPPCTKPGPFGYELCGVCKSPGWRAWLFVGSGRAAHAESMAARFLFAVGVGLALFCAIKNSLQRVDQLVLYIRLK